MNPRIGWGQPPTGCGLPHLPGWAPLVDPGPRPLQTARSVSRWLWPTLAVSSFLAVAAYTIAHDDPAPGLSHRGLLTIALAALVVILLTIHRRTGPGPLARALTEYTVVALLATLLAAGGGAVDQQPADRPTPAKSGQARPKTATEPKTEAAAGEHQSTVIRVGAAVVRGVSRAAGALAGGLRWLVDLWRQADRTTERSNGRAMAAPPLSPLPSPRSIWRSP